MDLNPPPHQMCNLQWQTTSMVWFDPQSDRSHSPARNFLTAMIEGLHTSGTTALIGQLL